MRAGLCAALLLAASSLRAGDWCGTSAENDAALRKLHQRNASRITTHGSAPIRYRDGVFVMQSDSRVAVNDHPLDLIGRTLSAKRIDEERFEVTRTALRYADPGPLLATIARDGTETWHYRKRDLTAFSFPLGNTQQQSLYISAFGAIYFAPPPPPPSRQLEAVPAIAAPQPFVAPLLMASTRFFGSVDVHVRETTDRVVVTWKWLGADYHGELRFRGDVQAVLYANGDIDFSYVSIERSPGGAAVITTGSESARLQNEVVASATDTASDTDAQTPAAFRDLADIRALEIGRSPLDLVDIRIEVGRPIDFSGFSDPDAHLLSIGVITGDASFVSDIRRSGTTVSWTHGDLPSSMFSFSGSSFHFRVPRQYLPAGTFDLQVYISAGGTSYGDSADLSDVTIADASGTLESDLSAASQTVLRAPIVEAFLIPSVDLQAVWDALEKQFALSFFTAAVAIYTTFPTDIDFSPARAYAFGGNSGVDGIGAGHSSSAPRTPTMLHMNLAHSMGPLLHELGHRWLFYVSRKDGPSTIPLTSGSHPWTKLDTTAAFTDGDSPMGGARYDQLGGGMFQRVCGTDGFSWLDLYLMGLARPDEVREIFDVGDTVFTCNQTKQATKTSATIQQVIDAMGVRTPSYATSPKLFFVAFVLLENPQTTWAGAEAAVRSYSTELVLQFSEATRYRGSIVRVEIPGSPRRRSVRH